MFTYYWPVKIASTLNFIFIFTVTVSDLMWAFCPTPNGPYYPALVNVGEKRGATERHVRSVRDLYSECIYRAQSSGSSPALCVSAEVVLRNGLRTGAAVARAGGSGRLQ